MTRTPDLTLAQVAEELNIVLKRAQHLRRIQSFPNAYSVGTKLRPEWRVPLPDVEAFKRARRAA